MGNEWQCGMWRFFLSEESPGHWRMTGKHKLSPSVQHDGGDEIRLLEDALVSAIHLEKASPGLSKSTGELEEMLQKIRRFAPGSVDQFSNEFDEIQKALFVYLGATPDSPGYQSLGDHTANLKEQFPKKWESLKADIDLVLRRVETIGWNRTWNPSMAKEADAKISAAYPWLSPEARRSLIDAFAFWNR